MKEFFIVAVITGALIVFLAVWTETHDSSRMESIYAQQIADCKAGGGVAIVEPIMSRGRTIWCLKECRLSNEVK